MELFAETNRPNRLRKLGSITEMVAHDLNNHLMLALNHLAAGDQAAVRKSIESCSGLTTSLLNYTRGPAMMRRVPLESIVMDAVMDLAVPSGVTLQKNFGRLRPGVLMNPREVCSAVTNLLFNGLAAVSPGGTVTIDVNGREIRVSDDGCGIAPELHDKIFERGFSTRETPGHGLGLSIVRDVMQKHGGSVSVASSPGQGSVFKLRFPSKR